MIKTIIAGHLTADPIIATRQIGDTPTKVANFTVAANQGLGDNKYTEFFRVALWRNQADFAESYLRKGRLVSVTGAIRKRSYVGNNGQPYTILEFVRPEVELLTANNAPAAAAAEEAEVAEEEPVDDGFPFEV